MKQKEIVTYNLAALKYLKRQEDAKRTATLLEEGITEEDLIKQMREKASIGEPKKRKRVAIQA